MSLKAAARDLLQSVVQRYGYTVAHVDALYSWQRPTAGPPPLRGRSDPSLREDHPRLRALAERYAAFDPTARGSDLWTADHVVGDRLRYFRGDDAYVWQQSGPNMNEFGYVLTTYYVRTIDALGLMGRFTDDDWFGNFIFAIDDTIVSRDKLDSILEIHFLERYLKLSSLSGAVILDIGAGYGRLAHRTCEALPQIAHYLCVDAVPQSTFISDFYLKFRGSKAAVVALDEVEATLREKPPNLAINVHSFSECRMEAIDWWLALLERYRVRHLMIVPNDPWEDGRGTLVTNDRQDFSKLVAKRGYRLIAHEPKYRDPLVHRYAINPTHYYLFELA